MKKLDSAVNAAGDLQRCVWFWNLLSGVRTADSRGEWLSALKSPCKTIKSTSAHRTHSSRLATCGLYMERHDPTELVLVVWPIPANTRTRCMSKDLNQHLVHQKK